MSEFVFIPPSVQHIDELGDPYSGGVIHIEHSKIKGPQVTMVGRVLIQPELRQAAQENQ